MRHQIYRLFILLQIIALSGVIQFLPFLPKIENKAQALSSQDDNAGFYYVNFDGDQTGISPNGAPLRENIQIDTQAGLAKLADNQLPGYFTTVEIRPSSFKQWNEIELTATYSNPLDLTVKLYDCTNPTPIELPSGDVPNMIPVNGKINISAIDPELYPCIRVRIDLNKSGSIAPTVDKIKVTWTKLPVFLITQSSPSTILAGDKIAYTINYSVSYTNDTNVVVYVPIPNSTNGTISNYTSSFNQDLTLSFSSANNGGQFTSNPLTLHGVSIPANSVYWVFPTIEAGKSGMLSYTLNTKNGIENGVTYTSKAFMDSQLGDLKESNTVVSTISSSPYASISKRIGSGALYVNGKYYVYDGGGYSPIIRFDIDVQNSLSPYVSRGVEEIFSPVTVDDLSNVIDILNTSCGGADGKITIQNNGVLDTNAKSITWNLPNGITPGNKITLSYTVDFTSCPDGLTINNVATLQGYNISSVNSNVNLYTGIDDSAQGYFAKGDIVNGFSSTSASIDDNNSRVQNYGEIATYTLSASNKGLVRLDDVVMLDKIPTGTTFENITAPVNTNPTFYYSTSTAYTDSTPPVFDYADPLTSGVWTNTMPSDKTTVTWIAVYLPCLSANYFPSPVGSQCYNVPTSVTASLQVKISTPANVCAQYDISNNARFYVYNQGADISNTDAVIALSPIMSAYENTEKTHVSPSLADFSASSSMIGPNTLRPLNNGEYIITVRNQGKDTSLNTSVEISIPQINVNGVNEYLSLSNVTGGIVDFSSLPSKITVNLGNIPANSSKEIRLTTTIPIGAKSTSSYTLSAKITGYDDNNCRNITQLLSSTTNILSEPSLSVVEERDVAIIAPKGNINYKYTTINSGDGPSTGTYIITKIPNKTVFDKAYTSGTNISSQTFNCPNCKVYFSNTNVNLPTTISIGSTFNGSLINNYFVQGTQSSPGVWTSGYAENTQYVAFLIDNSSLATPLFPSGGIVSTGLSVVNDDNGSQSGDTGSPMGTIITNYAATFSSELIQAIGNQVNTTILHDPGLRLTKTSDKSIVYAGEELNWTINYYNDSGNDDTNVVITDTLPVGTQILEVYHSWNDRAQTNGLPSGESRLDNISTPYLSIDYNSDLTTNIRLQIADSSNPSNGLRGQSLKLLEGGTIRLKVRTLNTLSSFTTVQNTVLGCFANQSNSLCISTNNNVIIENPDLFIQKIASNLKPVSGEQISYAVLLANKGKHDDTGVSIEDNLPIGLCYVANSTLSATSGWSIGEPTITGDCISTPQKLIWNVNDGNTIQETGENFGDLPGSSINIQFTFNALVNEDVNPGTTLVNGIKVSGDLAEDPIYPNEYTTEVVTPYPDVYIIKSAPRSVNPGDGFTYSIQYGNSSREAANNVYFIDTLPKVNNQVIKLVSVASTLKNESVYYHEATVDNQVPTFDPLDPITNGWTNDPTTITSEYVAVLVGALNGLEGPYNLQMTMQSVYASDNTEIPAGNSMVNAAKISCDSNEETLDNNESQATTKTPSIDLSIEKFADSEGGFPGLAPGDPITYTVKFKNSSRIKSCGVYIEDTFPNEIELQNPISDFTSLRLFNNNDEPISPINLTTGFPIQSQVNITQSGLTNNTYRWELGSSLTTPYMEVCLPPYSYGEFHINAKIKEDVSDEKIISNTARIGNDRGDVEDVLANNEDSTTTTIYLPDLMVNIEGYSCGIDNICNNDDDNIKEVNIGETIEYKVEYNNLGNIDAKDSIINQVIPQGTCYKINSAEQDRPQNTILEYSNDDGLTWSYNPINIGGYDCMVTNFRFRFTESLPGPINFISESGVFNGTKNQVTTTNSQLQLNPVDHIDEGSWENYSNSLGSGWYIRWDESQLLNWYANGNVMEGKIINYNNNDISYMSTLNQPGYRFNYSSVIVNNNLIVWGGRTAPCNGTIGYYASDNKRYNIDTDTWSPISSVNSPSYRGEHAAVSTGDKMIVWGGWRGCSFNTYQLFGDGAIYDLATDTWAPMATGPSPRKSPTTIWTGTKMILLGGTDPNDWTRSFDWWIYDLATNTWTQKGSIAKGFSVVWTGSKLIVWGGNLPYPNHNTAVNTGFVYDPATNITTPTSLIGAPSPMSYHQAVWTGDRMMVWYSGVGGGFYDPVTNTWSTIVTENAPTIGMSGAVWDTNRALLYGSNGYSFYNLTPSGFKKSGNYTISVNSENLIAWDRLNINIDKKENTNITYTIYQAGCYTPISGFQNMEVYDSVIDISSIPDQYTTLCLKLNFESTTQINTPSLRAWRITYLSSVKPKYSFSVRLNEDLIGGASTINSISSISTSTIEKTYVNNISNYIISIPQTDLSVSKSTNKSSILYRDNLDYTIKYCNDGPSSTDAIITDTLPSGISSVSMVNNELGQKLFTSQSDFENGASGGNYDTSTIPGSIVPSIDVDTNLYAIAFEWEDNLLRTIDPNTFATLSQVEITMPGESIDGGYGIAVDPKTNEIYALVQFSWQSRGTPGQLVKIDKVTGVATWITTMSDRFSNLAFSTDGTLYGVTGWGANTKQSLFEINKSTGAATFLVSYPARSYGGDTIAFNKDDGKMYHFSGNGSHYIDITDLSTNTYNTIQTTNDIRSDTVTAAAYMGNNQFVVAQYRYRTYIGTDGVFSNINVSDPNYIYLRGFSYAGTSYTGVYQNSVSYQSCGSLSPQWTTFEYETDVSTNPQSSGSVDMYISPNNGTWIPINSGASIPQTIADYNTLNETELETYPNVLYYKAELVRDNANDLPKLNSVTVNSSQVCSSTADTIEIVHNNLQAGQCISKTYTAQVGTPIILNDIESNAGVTVNRTVTKLPLFDGDTYEYTVNYANNTISDVTDFRITDTLPSTLGAPTSTATQNTNQNNTMQCDMYGSSIICSNTVDINIAPISETSGESVISNEFQNAGNPMGWNSDDGEWIYTLPFTFPFYGTDYSEIKIGSNGIICLDTSVNCRWFPDNMQDGSYGPVIMPLAVDLMTNVNSGDDIYITETSDYVVIRWKVVDYADRNPLNFEAVITKEGIVKFNYGSQTVALSDVPLVGVMKGDGITYFESSYSGIQMIDGLDTVVLGDLTFVVNGTLHAGESGSYTVIAPANVGVMPDDFLINSVSITSSLYDPDLSNNYATASSIVGDYPNVYVRKTAPLFANINKELIYTIEYGNDGNAVANNVEIRDVLDANTTYVSFARSGGVTNMPCSAFGNTVICIPDGGVLQPGESGTLTIRVRVLDDIDLILNSAVLLNTVSIETSSEETNILDNTSSATTRVRQTDVSSISGRVFYDKDKNIQYSATSEFGIEGVDISLSGYDIYGNIYGPATSFTFFDKVLNDLRPSLIAAGLINSSVTNTDIANLPTYRVITPVKTDFVGEYSFAGLNPGTYIVNEIQPFDYLSVGSNGGFSGYNTNGDPVYNLSKDGLGSNETGNFDDANIIRRIILGDGEGSLENNFAETGGIVGDQVFYDRNKNGIYEVKKDIPLSGIKVTLYGDINQNGELDTGDRPMRITATNENGLYYFTDLKIDDPGGDHDFDYLVAVTDNTEGIIEGINTRGQYGVNNNSQDSLGYWTPVDANGPDNLTADFGFYHESFESLVRTGDNMLIVIVGASIVLIATTYLNFKKPTGVRLNIRRRIRQLTMRSNKNRLSFKTKVQN